MSRDSNFLIGSGEKLISKEVKVNSGGKKRAPYEFEEAKKRIGLQLESIIDDLSELPKIALHNNEAVLSLTLHPRYVSKSDHPQKFLESRNFEALGSKPKYVKPEKWGTKKPPENESLTDVYYIKSSIDELNSLLREMEDLPENDINKTICYFEEFELDKSLEKLQGDINEFNFEDKILMECVLHQGALPEVIADFFNYLSELNGNISFKSNKVRSVGQLGFVPIVTDSKSIEEIGKFSFLRAFRRMPKLRPFRPSFTRTVTNKLATLPERVLFDNVNAVIFDGGLPQDVSFPSFVKYEEIEGIGPPVDDLTQHGLAVTSAYLFGPINNLENLQPISNVTHVRVLGEKHMCMEPSSIEDIELYDVIDSMVEYMEREGPDLVNISLGPDSSVDDYEVTYWTSKLDSYAAQNDILITIAAGNNGNNSEFGGLNRVQVPSDGVNILSIGAANSIGDTWERASYSAMGPGRNPGIIKPDIIAYGGDENDLFGVIDSQNEHFVLNGQIGTSFAAPLVLRHAAFIKGHFGTELTNMAIRGILIHQASMNNFNHNEVGWGKCHDDLEFAITCDDNEVTVIYQDELAVGSLTRLPLPIKDINFDGFVNIKCTIVSRTEVDAEYAAAYTKNGFEVAFRPDERCQKIGSEHPSTKSFFPQDKVSKNSEHIMKSQGAKWECVRKGEKRFRSTSLFNSVFDLTSHHRNQGQNEFNKQPIQFVCVITIKCEKVNDLYNEVVRNYRGILNPLTPQQTIQLKI